MEMKRFFRVSNVESEQGLWYDFAGNFTGLIHNEFNFCANSGLKMDYDETLLGYLSSIDTLDGIYQWFSEEELVKLQSNGFYLHEYKAIDYWFYEPFKHWVINQETSIISKRIILI